FKHSGGTATTLKTALEHGPATTVSPRDYLHDAAFLVALAGQSSLIEECVSALREPVWPLFLGRKGCPPTRPLLLVDPPEYADLESALKLHPRLDSDPKNRGKLAAYIEDPQGTLERQDAMRINQLRMYEFRNCRYLEVDPPCTSPD
ncbi:MAG: hypothetical protein IT203_07100, partial [Fimbriimonadaceae bacterium]|nr:hypothetical protein [Fimbriimonadaceae bacterium]